MCCWPSPERERLKCQALERHNGEVGRNVALPSLRSEKRVVTGLQVFETDPRPRGIGVSRVKHQHTCGGTCRPREQRLDDRAPGGLVRSNAVCNENRLANGEAIECTVQGGPFG